MLTNSEKDDRKVINPVLAVGMRHEGGFYCTEIVQKYMAEVYKNTKRNTSAKARSVRSVAVTLATV